MSTVYFDNLAGTPLHPEVQGAMIEHLREVYGNPSSQHHLGDRAGEALELARERVAALVGASPKEIVFTSGGTESINHAIKGVALARREQGRHLVTSNVEHNAVIKALRSLKAQGWRITSLDVDHTGLVDPRMVEKAIEPETTLVSVMYANNEIGTLQPVKEIAAVAKKHKVLYHCDAVDAVGVVPVDVRELGADLVSLAANQFYGPPGVGALYIRKGTPIWPLLDGGGQENNKRAGTENLIGIVGMGKAAELAKANLAAWGAHTKALRDRLRAGIQRDIPDVIFNGHPEQSLPNLLSVSIAYIEGESVMLLLDEEGICVSTKSACASGSLRASHVLLSCGLDHAAAQGTMVISLGHQNTEAEVDYFLAKLKPVVERLRAMSPLARPTR